MTSTTILYPKISVVTPTFNRAQYLEQTILSVLDQNYPNLEYIIIDGGSTDGSADIIRKYENRLKYWISEPDDGMYFALQKGFKKATGEIMAWINSDDIYHKGAFHSVAEIFSNLTDVEWITGIPTLFNSDGLCVKVNDIQYWSNRRIYSGDYRWIQQENVFWKRSLWIKAGSQLELKYKLACDFALWNRFFQHAQLYSVQTSFGGFRLHGQQLSINHSSQYESEASHIFSNSRINGPRLMIGRLLYTLMNKTKPKKNFILSFTRILANLVLKRVNKYPPVIYYDFLDLRWKK